MHPQQFVLGATCEFLRLPSHLGAYVLGRSSWGRLGLLVATAVMIQPGFSGCITLELVNAGDSPIRLFPGLKVAQLAVHSTAGSTAHAYSDTGGSYRSPTGPQAGRLTKRFERPESGCEFAGGRDGLRRGDEPAAGRADDRPASTE